MTIVVGDLHLMSGLILPLVDEVMKGKHITHIILTGDYCDQWSQQMNANLYKKDLSFLVEWKKKKEESGIQVTCLLGNHDLPYILDSPAHYSLSSREDRMEVRSLLLQLKPQISVFEDEFLISHGGYLGDYEVHKYEQTTITEELLEERMFKSHLKLILHEVGMCRGGFDEHGGPVWADIREEFAEFPNQVYKKQIVGHRPLSLVTKFDKGDNIMIGIDTFTISRTRYYPFFYPIADVPGFVSIEDGGWSMVPLVTWQEPGIEAKIFSYFTDEEEFS